MPKSPVAHGAGNINLKGKKSKVLSCNCCEAIDFRERELARQAQKEIRHAYKFDDHKAD
jgi:hypothetical protein